MQTVALIDYGSGNLPSADKALRKAAASLQTPITVVTTDDPEVIARADRVVLPGVGAFAACMGALQARGGVIEAMGEAVIGRGAPFLGICVGMQLLATRGLEFGETAGLGWIASEVRRLQSPGPTFKIPHMGWNGLTVSAPEAPLFAGLNSGVHMYFTHSYALYAERETDVAAWTDHGGAFAAAVVRGNISGVQFHPEKSQGAGARLLGNFLKWRP
jgi:imidazole glycerol-phosphate synthase subunit HisH